MQLLRKSVAATQTAACERVGGGVTERDEDEVRQIVER